MFHVHPPYIWYIILSHYYSLDHISSSTILCQKKKMNMHQVVHIYHDIKHNTIYGDTLMHLIVDLVGWVLVNYRLWMRRTLSCIVKYTDLYHVGLVLLLCEFGDQLVYDPNLLEAKFLFIIGMTNVSLIHNPSIVHFVHLSYTTLVLCILFIFLKPL